MFQKHLTRESFDISYRISYPGLHGVARPGYGQLDAAHRASTFFSTEIMQTGRLGVKDFSSIYFNKTIGNRNFSVAVNVWKRRIYHEAPGLFK